VDTTQATAANRILLYVNGDQVSAFSTSSDTSPSFDTAVNTTTAHRLGNGVDSGGGLASYFDGYLANIHFIDGQALTPSSFTETDATTGQLIPKTYTGSYGTNGFNLLFADNSSNTASTLGKDTSPNGNNWTPNNLSVTAGAGNDSLVDSPTNYGTDTGVGGSVRGNYCTLNPLNNGGLTLANGNLDYSHTVSAWDACTGSICIASGKWYWEVTVATWDGTGAPFLIGIANTSQDVNAELGQSANSWVYLPTGQKRYNGSSSSYGASLATGDVVGIALDMDAGTLTFYKNGSSQGQAFTSITGNISPAVGVFGNTSQSGAYSCNFGQRAFAYPLSTYKSLCTQNLPTPLVAKSNTVFDVKLYTGTGTTNSITGLAFSPDFIWLKSRSAAQDNNVFDVVRGPASNLYALQTNGTSAEGQYGTVGSLDSTGFTLTGAGGATNANSSTYVAWAWDAGTSTVSNTAGSITSQVRANATAGFSVVTYTGNAVSGATVGHGLGVAPNLIIIKSRSGTHDWIVYHASIGNTGAVRLNTTAATQTLSVWFNNSGPSSTTFTLGNTAGTNESGSTFVAYAFAPVVGHSSFGSYTGNGSADGPFVYTGFRVKWYLVKQSSAAGENWRIIDATRSSYNVAQDRLLPNTSAVEAVQPNEVDFLSNGFKFRSADSAYNASGGTYIYAAFAEMPFNYSRAR
jgi:hypothetical protein